MITLKLCDDWANGSLVAAPTSSLPAPIGGVRNWDYRYTWIRDAAYAVFALRRVGIGEEADAFLGWILDAFEQSRRPRIMYTLGGDPVPEEIHDADLEGYRRSAPVRWGNGAADQRQHDVYGEVLDCADQWLLPGRDLEPALWSGLSELAEAAAHTWWQPDQGIWEVRSEGRVFTYSTGMCQVALDRAAAIGERLGLSGPIATWRATAEKLRLAHPGPGVERGHAVPGRAPRRWRRPGRQPAGAAAAQGHPGLPSPHDGHDRGHRRAPVGR
ncbi:glycoside hydrolase family 15 protein [Nonomuraea ferruginea]